MKKSHLILTCLLFTSAVYVHASASCSAAIAAEAGAKAGYEEDRKATKAWSEEEKQAGDGLSQCLGTISTTVTTPAFPDLNSVLNNVKDKVCSVAQDKIQSLIPDNFNPWEDLVNGRMPKLPDASTLSDIKDLPQNITNDVLNTIKNPDMNTTPLKKVMPSLSAPKPPMAAPKTEKSEDENNNYPFSL